MAEQAAAIEAKYAQNGQQGSAAPATGAASAAPKLTDEGGEATMSVADSNALRASLGLKPLVQNTASKDDVARAEHRRHMDNKRRKEQAAQEKALHEKLEASKEQRRIDAELSKHKGLGESSGQDGDDVLVRVSGCHCSFLICSYLLPVSPPLRTWQQLCRMPSHCRPPQRGDCACSCCCWGACASAPSCYLTR